MHFCDPFSRMNTAHHVTGVHCSAFDSLMAIGHIVSNLKFVDASVFCIDFILSITINLIRPIPIYLKYFPPL